MVGNDEEVAAKVIAAPLEEVKQMSSPESGLMKLAKSDEEEKAQQPIDKIG